MALGQFQSVALGFLLLVLGQALEQFLLAVVVHLLFVHLVLDFL